ncbi:UNVERIFIED_CONTAM: hypothetical protein K2H54_033294 [Gekko kuhli]
MTGKTLVLHAGDATFRILWAVGRTPVLDFQGRHSLPFPASLIVSTTTASRVGAPLLVAFDLFLTFLPSFLLPSPLGKEGETLSVLHSSPSQYSSRKPVCFSRRFSDGEETLRGAVASIFTESVKNQD